MLAIQFNSQLLGQGFVEGIAAFALYGLIAVGLVVTYRISRTVAFINGGILLTSTLCYWWLTAPAASGVSAHPSIPGPLALIIMTVAGFGVAAGYGYIVTGRRVAEFPRLTVTIISLAAMLLLVGIAGTVITAASGQPTVSAFGEHFIQILGDRLPMKKLVPVLFLGVIVLGLQALLKTTRTGVFARAIGDNPEAARLVGISINRVSTLMYGISGAVSALVGSFMAANIGTDQNSILFEFLRGMMVCLVGGFGSIGLALAGAFVFALVDTYLQAGLFGQMSSGTEFSIVMLMLFGIVVLNTRYGKQGKEVLAAKGF